MCLRSARLTEMPSPDEAKQKQRETGVGIQGKKKEEEGRRPSDPKRLRSRKITVPPGGEALESEPPLRVTRNAKRGAENIKKASNLLFSFFFNEHPVVQSHFCPMCKSKENVAPSYTSAGSMSPNRVFCRGCIQLCLSWELHFQ